MKKPTYITNGYTLVSEDCTGYSGVIVGNTLELRHSDRTVDSVTLDDYLMTVGEGLTMYNTTALQIYNDMLEYALSQEN